MRAVLFVLAVLLPLCGHAERATERYADVQLQVAQDFLQRAREAANSGQRALAGALAWQAALDARIAVGMTESAKVRIGASMVASEAHRLVHGVASVAP